MSAQLNLEDEFAAVATPPPPPLVTPTPKPGVATPQGTVPPTPIKLDFKEGGGKNKRKSKNRKSKRRKNKKSRRNKRR